MYCRPPSVLPAVVYPTKQCVQHTFSATEVPHIHPTHNTLVNHQLYQHKHYYPQTQSVVNEVSNQHFNVGPSPLVSPAGVGPSPFVSPDGVGPGPGMAPFAPYVAGAAMPGKPYPSNVAGAAMPGKPYPSNVAGAAMPGIKEYPMYGRKPGSKG